MKIWRASKEILGVYRTLGLPENFCPAPFTTLVFEADGTVVPCRHLGSDFSVGDLKHESLDEIWNGERLRDLRREFLTGKTITCAKRIAHDSCHVSAENAALLSSLDISLHQTRPPRRISPNFNGRCNIRCKMCKKWKFPNGLYDTLGFWERLEREVLPGVEEIDTFSGEPFIQKDTYRLLDLAHKINPGIRWSFTTNGNWKFNRTIEDYLDRIDIRSFSFSLDTLDPERYARIREGGRLEVLLETFGRVREYERKRLAAGRGPVGLTINFLLQRENWRDLPAILAFRREMGVRIFVETLREPVGFSVLTLGQEDRLEILRFFLESLPPDDLLLVTRLVRSLMDGLAPLERGDVLVRYRERMVPLCP